MNTKITLMLDASALRAGGCIRKLCWIVVDGYRAKVNNNDIEFGSAFHIFRSIYRQKGMAGFAEGVHSAQKYFVETPMIVKSNKKYLTPTYLANVCSAYMYTYPAENKDIEVVYKDDKPCVEIPFTIPYYVDDKVEILLAGTIDEICKKQNGIYLICDAKTTSAYAKDEYFLPYMLSHQFLFYIYIIYQYAHNYPNSLYAKMVDHDCLGFFVDGVFLKSTGDVEFARSPIRISKRTLIEQFSRLLYDTVQKLVAAVHKYPEIPLPEGIITQSCQSKFGTMCDFFGVCNAPDEEAAASMLNTNYKKEFYNPQEWGGKYS